MLQLDKAFTRDRKTQGADSTRSPMQHMNHSTRQLAPQAMNGRDSGRFPSTRATAPWLALVVVLASTAAWWLLPPEAVIRWTDESAFIERATVALYLASGVAVLAAWRSLPAAVAATMALTMLAFAVREADLHIHLTGTSMLRVSYYLRPAPLLHKLAGLAVIGGLLGGWLYLAVRMVRAWGANQLGAGALGTNVGTFLGVLVFTKVVDRSLSILVGDFGVRMDSGMRALQVAIEEPLEMALPLMVVAGLRQYLAARAP